ncbi:unnamed protein product [Discula destructiva]
MRPSTIVAITLGSIGAVVALAGLAFMIKDEVQSRRRHPGRAHLNTIACFIWPVFFIVWALLWPLCAIPPLGCCFWMVCFRPGRIDWCGTTRGRNAQRDREGRDLERGCAGKVLIGSDMPASGHSAVEVSTGQPPHRLATNTHQAIDAGGVAMEGKECEKAVSISSSLTCLTDTNTHKSELESKEKWSGDL